MLFGVKKNNTNSSSSSNHMLYRIVLTEFRNRQKLIPIFALIVILIELS